MFERFTDGARNVMARSRALADEERSPNIRRHHMLVALLTDAEERPEAIPALILAEANIDLAGFREQVLESLRASEEPSAAELGGVKFSSGAKKALELSLREALSLGHNYVGCEHIVLAILRSADGPLATTIGATSLNYGTARAFVGTYPSANRSRGRSRFGRTPVIGPFRRTDAADRVLERAHRRARNERAMNTGDLLIALVETSGTHFTKLLGDLSLPNSTDLAAQANALVEANAPDGAPDPVRVDPRTGAMTVTDPELAAKLKDVPGEKIAEALRRLLDDA